MSYVDGNCGAKDVRKKGNSRFVIGTSITSHWNSFESNECALNFHKCLTLPTTGKVTLAKIFEEKVWSKTPDESSPNVSPIKNVERSLMTLIIKPFVSFTCLRILTFTE